MKYAVEMGAGVMMYIHSQFHKQWFRHWKVKGLYIQTHRQQDILICLRSFLQNKESKLRKRPCTLLGKR
jgi:hypothetical protein